MGRRMSFSLALFSVFLVSLHLQEVESCGRGWLRYEEYCYGYFRERKTWAEAQVDCQSMKANLASIHNKEESDQVAKYVSSKSDSTKNVWIGMHVPTGTNVWAWVDHTRIKYLAWNTGEPNNFSLFGKEECVQLVSELDFLRWNDAVCSSQRPYLCKMRNIPTIEIWS